MNMLRLFTASIVLIALGIVIVSMIEIRTTSVPPTESVATTFYTARLGGQTLVLEVATTPEEKQRGLSGRRELPEGTGMLFSYEQDGYYGFWMPDMYLAIDIIWFDAMMRVVHIEEFVLPESYPTVYKPTLPARHIIEVPAGWVERHNISVGDELRL